ncbi:VOC family protein [Flagellimonas meishanensis]|uniref:VOC family protein n=1 Tax=Flagellimonas meishanensis TaxID=2873264 RepID=UPI00223A81E1|nr:VOC family protein [[Muricauda] meishanensis]
MKMYLALIFGLIFLTLSAQQDRLAIFDHLMGKTWKAEGEWGDGTKFKQETSFRYSLDSTLIIAESEGFTDRAQTTFGPRNHGIRKFDPQTNSVKFWEFDVFGGVTEGTVKSKGKDIMYVYDYGESTITDYWEYVDDSTYNFIVGSYKDGTWEQTYLKTQFLSEEPFFEFQFDHYAILVANLEKTGDFYRDVFSLTEIPAPNFAPGYRWFQMNNGTQLHLIEKEGIEFKKDKNIHLCLSTQNLEGFTEHVMAKGVDFYDWPGNKNSISDRRPDGVKQIYIQDPEGYWIEINDAKH